MQKYQFLENPQRQPLIIKFGELGLCQLLRNRLNNQLYILKLSHWTQTVKDLAYLPQLNHHNIIKIIEYFEYEDSILIVFQFLANGDLLTKIRCKQIKQANISQIFKGICSAVKYLHHHNIIHRNLKAQTILLDNKMTPKVTDLGLSANLGIRKSFCGCYSYMAPQLLLKQQYDQRVDIWGLGIILYEMVHGRLPFEGENEYQVLTKIKGSQIYLKSFAKGSVHELIRMILNYDPKHRLSLEEIFHHPFLCQNQSSISNKQQNKFKQNKPITKIKRKKNYSQILNCRNIFYKKKNRKIEDKSILQMMKSLITNKIESVLDQQKISINPHYNFIVNI